MVRSNPGLMLIKNGTILNKWSDEDIPDEYVLTDKLENLPLGKQKVSSDAHTVGYVFLWFVIPLLLVLGWMCWSFAAGNGKLRSGSNKKKR